MVDAYSFQLLGVLAGVSGYDALMRVRHKLSGTHNV